MEKRIDGYIVKDLNLWLDHNIDGDVRREAVRAQMLNFVRSDEKYWGSQNWWLVYDRAKCGDIPE